MQKQTAYVGMDVHKDTITLAVYLGDEQSYCAQKTIPNDKAAIRKHLKKISSLGNIRCCYEAGFSGFELYRFIDSLGHDCQVIAPSLIPKKSGDKIKTDRKDAQELAKLLRADLLTPVAVPTAETERVRSYIRLRFQIQQDLSRTKQRILKFLHTKGLVFRGTKKNWTKAHRRWLEALNLEFEDQFVLSEHLTLLSYLEGRLSDIDQGIEQIADSDQYRSRVKTLTCLKGIGTFSAMVILSEIGDFKRFARPRQLMSYIGLIPSENSSGLKQNNKGHITKCGNSKLRHVMIEAAWHYRSKPHIGHRLAEQYADQPKEVVLYATKAMQRLHKRYWRLAACKSANVATVAVARELTGFIWGIMQADLN
jgi:transposase